MDQGKLQTAALDGLNVAVLGAGIGGLTAALALAARGARVTVHEQAPAITEVGAGLQISPNGAVVLKALGLKPELDAIATWARHVILHDYRRAGEVIRLDVSHGGQAAYALVHRADLIAFLERAARARGIGIFLGRQVASVAPGTPATVTFADGATLQADLVVGADGVHSVARAALNDAASARFTGQVAWRATVPMTDPVDPDVRLYMGPGRHLVRYPLRGGQLMNIVAVEERRGWAEEGWHHTDDPANLRAAFAAFRGEVPGLLAQVDHVALWGLFRHPVAARWTGPGTAILGDAAHPTLPFLAQGANLAMEDAYTLARCLAEGSGAQNEKLMQYQRRRRDRAAKVIDASTRNAWKYHVRFQPARLIGHTGLSILGRIAPDAMTRQFDWIHAHDVTA
ncbi:FAD-dependent monooxygenase [Chachezhania sediminis]|uniref:FAD-dependent monooxygenase n=1 Tax=Chachezhania sediminis TaxID=2599291 RepID=UPI00131BF360|nr:FAD-dependent monooxygenase [Chachezhania sediminis]